MKSVAIFAAGAMLVGGCAQHRLTVPRPDPTGQAVTVNSNAFLLGVRQPRTKAECPTNLLAEVRVHQNVLQALATVITLGLWQPTRLEYRCAKVPNPDIGTMDEGEAK